MFIYPIMEIVVGIELGSGGFGPIVHLTSSSTSTPSGGSVSQPYEQYIASSARINMCGTRGQWLAGAPAALFVASLATLQTVGGDDVLRDAALWALTLATAAIPRTSHVIVNRFTCQPR